MNDTFCADHVANIEFRWLKRAEMSAFDGGYQVGRHVPVLQVHKLWREAGPIDATVSDTKEQRWSEWTDVPTATERPNVHSG